MGSRITTSSGALGSKNSESPAKFQQQDSGIQANSIGCLRLRDFNVNNNTNNINNTQDRKLSPEEVKDTFIQSLEFEEMHERHDTIEDNTSNTCQWLLKTDEWREWQMSVETQDPTGLYGRHPRRLFWIKGQPGAGKSTYMKFAVRHARIGRQFSGNLILAHFFNARARNDLAKSIEGMYRTLLTQLLQNLSPGTVQILARSRRTEIKSEWKLGTLSNLFRDVIRNHITKPVTCFIDALDECAEEQIQNMVNSFRDLAEDEAQSLRFRACFASRYYPRVTMVDGTAIDFRLDQQLGHLEDIETYIKRHLQVSGSQIALIVHEKVREKAQGVFIWCKLAIGILNKEYNKGGLTQVEDLQEKLDTIPANLHRLFSAILGLDGELRAGSDSYSTRETTLCLQWVLFSQDRDVGPLWWAIQRTSRPKTTTATLAAQYRSMNRDTMKRYILNLAKGLLEVVETWNQKEWMFGSLQVIHESVRDFLLKGGLAQLMGMHKSTENDWRAAQVTAKIHQSLQEIAFHESLQHHDETFARWPECTSDLFRFGHTLEQNSPLLLYSKFSVYHANEACRALGTNQAPFLKELGQQEQLDRQWKLRSLIWHPQCERRHNQLPRGPLPVFRNEYLTGSLTDLLIYENSEFLLRDLYSNQPKELYPTERPTLRHCLHWRYGISGETFQAMVNVNVKWHEESMSPRHGALKRLADAIGHSGIDFGPGRDKLKDNGPVLGFESYERGPTLDEDAIIIERRYPDRGIFFLAALLPSTPEAEDVVVTWERETRENPGKMCCFSSFVLLALQHMTHSEARQVWDLGELLLLAAYAGNEALARLLLNKFDTPCNVQRKTGRTPLHYAAIGCGDLPIFQLLLSRADINPELVNRDGDMAIHSAVSHGNAATMKNLLAPGKVDINSKNNEDQTALHRAVREADVAIVKELLASENIDANSKTDMGNTPLHFAVDHGLGHIRSAYKQSQNENPDWKIIQTLLASEKVNANSQNHIGNTPLHLAATRRCYSGRDICRILLASNKIDVNLKNIDGQTPLHYAIQGNPWMVSPLLSSKHIDVNVKDSRNKTPRDLAWERGDRHLALFLGLRQLEALRRIS